MSSKSYSQAEENTDTGDVGCIVPEKAGENGAVAVSEGVCAVERRTRPEIMKQDRGHIADVTESVKTAGAAAVSYAGKNNVIIKIDDDSGCGTYSGQYNYSKIRNEIRTRFVPEIVKVKSLVDERKSGFTEVKKEKRPAETRGHARNILETPERARRESEDGPAGATVLLPVSQIFINPFKSRTVTNRKAIDELIRSVEKHGIIKPIYVRKTGSARYELLTGAKRLYAARMLKLETVPAKVFGDADSMIKFLAESKRGEGGEAELNFFEEAEWYKVIMTDKGFTQLDLSEKIGKSQSAIANKIRLLRLSAVVRKQITEAGLSERHARALLRMTDEKIQKMVLKSIVDNNFTAAQTDKLITAIFKEHGLKIKRRNGKKEAEDKLRAETEIMKAIAGKILRSESKAGCLRSLIEAVKTSAKRASEAGLVLAAGQRNKEEYIELVIRIPKAENGIMKQNKAVRTDETAKKMAA